MSPALSNGACQTQRQLRFAAHATHPSFIREPRAGLLLDGGKSGARFHWRSVVQSWITERLGINRKCLTFRVATE